MDGLVNWPLIQKYISFLIWRDISRFQVDKSLFLGARLTHFFFHLLRDKLVIFYTASAKETFFFKLFLN
jgi:hypothetical protein